MNRFYTVREASKLLDRKVRTVRDLVVRGKIKAAKFPGSRRWVIPESEIERLKGKGYGNKEFLD